MNDTRRSLIRHLKSVPNRQKDVLSWYMLMLMMGMRKSSLSAASRLSGKSLSCFSEFLRKSLRQSGTVLTELICRAAFGVSRSALVSGAPWTVAIIIDSTLHKRSSQKVKNAQKFNHGQGFVFGHQWTNVVLMINGQCLPLAPIPFFTKAYCKKQNIPNKTEHTRVCEFLSDLNLETYIGHHHDDEVVVLMDSGYDNRKLQNVIQSRGWAIVASLRSSSTALRGVEASESRYKSLSQIFLRTPGLVWHTVYAFTAGWKKRKDFRVCAAIVRLHKAYKSSLIVCSESRRDRQNSRRKFIMCSQIEIDPGVVVRTYRLRWHIEIFHKDVKSYLGMEDVAAHQFESVWAHVHWAYVAYIVLGMRYPSLTLPEAQQWVRRDTESEKLAHVLKISHHFGAMKKIKSYCFEELQRKKAA